ncbi:MAG TPA: hypothetical protein VGY57_04885 [Vicinamibacterales bacterium]|nr:hypothetical protein [Vicinamibacterales bacterium]
MFRVKRAIAVSVLAAGALLTTSGRAAAVTVDQIVQLAKAGISEPVILALIDRDRTIFAIDPEQLVTLKQQGVSETVLIAMLKSGRAEGEAAARAASDANAAAMLAAMATTPELVIVGHGPEIPNGRRYDPYHDGSFSSVMTFPMFPMPTPYLSPYAPPALLIQSAPCVPRRMSPCAAPPRRGRTIR